MPPQMESCAACDPISPPRTRRALAHVSQGTKPGSITARARSKQQARSQDGSMPTLVSSSGTAATRLIPTRDFNSADDGEQAMTTVRDRVAAMQEMFGAQLEFLITEFTKLEEQLVRVPETGPNSASRGDNGLNQQLTRLRYFVAHVRRTLERMEQAKTGQHRYSLEQLDMLDDHITKRLLPVKDKLLAQLAQRPGTHESLDPSKTCPYRLLNNGNLMLGDASAVSEGWISSDGSATDNEVSNATSIARPCSSLSLAELGELCGDQPGDDYAGSFLVGQDCDVVDESGIGLDLYDEGHGKDFLMSRDNARADSMSTMSADSAMTDEELSDDSLSVEGTNAASLAKSAIDQEMGELSKLFAPDDAFLASSLLDPEDRETGARAETTEAEKSTTMTIEPSLQDCRGNDYERAKQDVSQTSSPSALGSTLEPKAELSRNPVVSPAPFTAVEVGSQQLQLQQSVENASMVASLGATASASIAMSHPVKKEGCACSSSIGSLDSAVLSKRRVESLVHPAQGAKVEGSAMPQVPLGPPPPHHSFRQRKRQRSSLAPILCAPRNVKYECSLCKESYQSSILSNPWWSLFKHECPRCHRMQIPRVDAASAAVCVDSIHAVCAEEGEGGDSDGYGSDSCSETDDDDNEGPESLAVFDTEVVAADCSPGDPESRLSTSQASRLLVLMAHARNCPGVHANPRHAEACQATKFLMLHIRDCSGHGPRGEPCAHSWCRPCKSLLSHLVRCPMPSSCGICSPLELSASFHRLRELNAAQARVVAAAASVSRATTTIKTEDIH